MDAHKFWYLHALKRIGVLAAAVYTLQGNTDHAFRMHQMVICLICMKWGGWIYSRLT